MNILKYSILLAILLKYVIASESGVANDVIDVLEEDGFVRIKRDFWRVWENRNDLFDEVVTKSVMFIAEFIKQVEKAKSLTLAALFVKRPDMVDQVLEKIKYSDNDLIYLTDYRPELAESHESFFKVIDKIKKPGNQESAIGCGVNNLFNAKKYDSVIHLIDALENREFNGRKLNDVAIQQAFKSGAIRGIKDIVEKLHEHPAITSKWYAIGLKLSWVNGKSKRTFPFLLAQADQGDLEKVKEHDKYKYNPEFRKAIDGAISKAEPAGARLCRPKRRAEIAKEAFSETASIQSLAQEKGPGDIIVGYLCGSEGTEGGKGQ
jgi:hypothetical protein